MLFCNGVSWALEAAGVGWTATGGLSGALCAPAVRAIRPSHRIAVTASDVFTGNLFLLWNELLRDGKRPPKPKCPRRNLQPGRRLLALVFIAVHMQRDVFHQLQVETVTICDLLGALQVLDICFQNAIQHIVRRQAILVLL